jgi:hypothetical protein
VGFGVGRGGVGVGAGRGGVGVGAEAGTGGDALFTWKGDLGGVGKIDSGDPCGNTGINVLHTFSPTFSNCVKNSLTSLVNKGSPTSGRPYSYHILPSLLGGNCNREKHTITHCLLVHCFYFEEMLILTVITLFLLLESIQNWGGGFKRAQSL